MAPGGAVRIAFAAPRILNEPIGCRHSSFSQISAVDSGAWSRTSGVRIATSAIRSRAALDLGERDQKSTSTPIPARGPLPRRAVRPRDPRRRSPIDLNSVSSSSDAATLASMPCEDLAQLGHDVVRPDALLRDREEVVAGLAQRRLAPVDEEGRRGDRLGAELSRLSVRERAGGVDVGPGASQSSSTSGSLAEVAVQTTSAPSSASSIEPATSECVSSASASACAGFRLQIRTIGSSSTVFIAAT